MIRNNKDLNLYLKILAEESIRKTYSQLDKVLLEAGEDDIFGGGDEEKKQGDDSGDEGGGDEAGADALKGLMGGGDKEGGEKGADAGGDMAAMGGEAPKKDKVNVRPVPLTLELGKVSSQGLIATFNMIRGGHSFNDPDINTQLEEYLEQELNDAERLALGTFLSAIRDIATGEPASEAPSPGDENVTIDASDKEKAQNAPTDVQQQQSGAPGAPPVGQPPAAPPQQPLMAVDPEEEPQEDLEDTTPPIQVGGRRNENTERMFRERIRNILNS